MASAPRRCSASFKDALAEAKSAAEKLDAGEAKALELRNHDLKDSEHVAQKRFLRSEQQLFPERLALTLSGR